MHRPSSPRPPRPSSGAGPTVTKRASLPRQAAPTPPAQGEIAVVSLRTGTPATRRDAFRRLLGRLFLGPGPRVVLLPGVQPGWPSSAPDVMAMAAEVGASTLFEVWRGDQPTWMASDETGAPLPVAVRQTFGNSGEANSDPDLVEDLLDLCAPGGERTVALS